MPKSSNEKEIDDYVRRVLAGKLIAGKLERASCQRYLDDLKRAKVRGLRFDRELANRAIDLARALTLSEGEYDGRPFELQPFQKFIVWNLFGWIRLRDGVRRFRQGFISLASGNGKTPFAAFIMILMMLFDAPPEPRAQCYVISTKESQARLVFDEVAAFRAKDEELQAEIEVYKKTMYCPRTGATLALIGAEGTVDDGLKPHCVIVDELHQFRKHHQPTLGIIKSKFGKRRQPLLLYITTAGDERSDVWIHEYNFARAVVERENPIDADDLFVFVAQIDDKDDEFDERNWPKANPMLVPGVVKLDQLRSQALRAKADPTAKNELVRFRMNRRVTSKMKVITSEMWASGDKPLPNLEGLTGHAGLDMGQKNDLCALAYAFPLDPVEIEGTKKPSVAVKARFWLPEDGDRDLTAEPWASWIEGGWLQVTHGKITDPESVYVALEKDSQQFGIGTVAMDPNNCQAQGVHIATNLGIPSFWFGQVPGKYNEPVTELLSMLHEGRLIHGGNPILAWCAMNLVLKSDARGYRMPDKERSEEKIDGIVAVLMALSECMFKEREKKLDYYATHDVEAG